MDALTDSKTVLIIDDDPVFMEAMATLLANLHGAIVLRACNGVEAFQHLDNQKEAISLIICDLNMPECNGIEVICELGRRRIQTPVLVVTGAVYAVVSAAEILARSHKLNILDIVVKPVRYDRLSATIDACLVGCASVPSVHSSFQSKSSWILPLI